MQKQPDLRWRLNPPSNKWIKATPPRRIMMQIEQNITLFDEIQEKNYAGFYIDFYCIMLCGISRGRHFELKENLPDEFKVYSNSIEVMYRFWCSEIENLSPD
eukprot:3800_1